MVVWPPYVPDRTKYTWEVSSARASCSVEYFSPDPTIMASAGGELAPDAALMKNITDETSVRQNRTMILREYVEGPPVVQFAAFIYRKL